MIVTVAAFVAIVLTRFFFIKDGNLLNTLYYTCSTSAALLLYSATVGWSLLDCVQGELDTLGLQIYYETQIGFYYASIVFLFCFNKNVTRKMIVHHFTVLLMILIAHGYSFGRIGFSVLLLHDITDIFLYLSLWIKDNLPESKYLKYTYTAFALTFFGLRLGVLPYYVFVACLPIVDRFERWVCWIGLVVLIVLHVLWSVEIVRVGRKTFGEN